MMTRIDADAVTTPFPALTHTNFQTTHLTDDGKQTRCGRDCESWAEDRYESRIDGKPCPRCGNKADFAAVLALSAEWEAQREAVRAENQRQFTLRNQAQNRQRRQIEAIIRKALREAGYEVMAETLPAGANTFVFTSTEYEPVAFEINVTERTEFANRVRAEQPKTEAL